MKEKTKGGELLSSQRHISLNGYLNGCQYKALHVGLDQHIREAICREEYGGVIHNHLLSLLIHLNAFVHILFRARSLQQLIKFGVAVIAGVLLCAGVE